jgi:D-arginine dehydrogenase
MAKPEHFDIAIIGGGIAGISFAAAVSSQAKVLLLESEENFSEHATGRSAAYFAPSYGNQVIRHLTAASQPTYLDGSADTFGIEVIKPRAAMFVGGEDQQASMKAMLDEQQTLQALGTKDIQSLVLIINDSIQFGLLDTSGGDMDVDAITQGYIRSARGHGLKVRTKARVDRLELKQAWHIQTSADEFIADTVVNAAGAWADHLAGLAGLPPLGLTPKRRTAVLVDAPEGERISHWPLTVDIDEAFYFKPDAGQLLISPADETPSDPIDAQPDELDIAIGIDRVSNVSSLAVKKINHKWAGLRTFAPDKSPVIGFDSRAQGFFWLAGQGGYGVQTAPAAAQLASLLCLKKKLPANLAPLEAGVSPKRLF